MMDDLRHKSMSLLFTRPLEKTMFFEVLEKEIKFFQEKMIPDQKNPQITASHKMQG